MVFGHIFFFFQNEWRKFDSQKKNQITFSIQSSLTYGPPQKIKKSAKLKANTDKVSRQNTVSQNLHISLTWI